MLIGSFFKKIKLFESNERLFQGFELSWEVCRAKPKFSENFGHRILELYSVLVQVQFGTSKAKLGI